jgi:putative oxidoreductase
MQKLQQLQAMLDKVCKADFLAPLALRLYLAPIFWSAGMNKLASFEDTVQWFGNPDWGLGLPFPWLMAALATATEVAGAVMLLLGIGVRWISVPLMITMLVAAFKVHWHNGWQAIADTSVCLFNCSDAHAAAERLQRAREILQTHGNYDWLTEQGNFVISNNGIEFAATYFVMLLALMFIGGGKYVSADYWIGRRFFPRTA